MGSGKTSWGVIGFYFSTVYDYKLSISPTPSENWYCSGSWWDRWIRETFCDVSLVSQGCACVKKLTSGERPGSGLGNKGLILVLLLISSGKWLLLSALQFPHLYIRAVSRPHPSQLWGLHEIIHPKHLSQALAHAKHSYILRFSSAIIHGAFSKCEAFGVKN